MTAQVPRWRFIGAFDISTEIGVSVVSFFLVSGVQMPFRRKVVVVTAFSSRLLVAIPASFHVHYAIRMLKSLDPTLIGSYVTVAMQLELSYGIMANTIPCLKPFMAAYEDMGKPTYSYKSRGQDGSHNNSGNSKSSHSRKYSRESFPLSRISKLKAPWASMTTTTMLDSMSQPAPPSPLPPLQTPSRATQPLRVDDTSYTATVRLGSEDLGVSSLESDDSRRLIIKKDVNWNVECTKCAEREAAESSGANRRNADV
ncbi:hypothetical protein AJ79_05399 [Helicocarpus griseus UAMH5409]|uniref:Rhodopsin domain-containing protein n=1 Tax=Helicocarpus griseus UAMH5409 TaxID=1447875 RepID=A0A2B7XPZ8_9EURO|nr:hypothetical protein AJ79_05399 [Helicocarpus griseus UAMH5409]